MKNLLKKTTFAVGLLLAIPNVLYGQVECKVTGGNAVCMEINSDARVATNNCQNSTCTITQNQTTVTAAPAEGNSVGDVAHDFNLKKAIKITTFNEPLTVKIPAKGNYSLYSFTLIAGNDKGKQVYLAMRNETLSPEVKAALAKDGKDTLVAVWVNVDNHKSKNKNKELKHEFVETAEISFSKKDGLKELQFSLSDNGEIMGGGVNKDGSIGSFAISSDLHTTAGLLKTN